MVLKAESTVMEQSVLLHDDMMELYLYFQQKKNILVRYLWFVNHPNDYVDAEDDGGEPEISVRY